MKMTKIIRQKLIKKIQVIKFLKTQRNLQIIFKKITVMMRVN